MKRRETLLQFLFLTSKKKKMKSIFLILFQISFIRARNYYIHDYFFLNKKKSHIIIQLLSYSLKHHSQEHYFIIHKIISSLKKKKENRQLVSKKSETIQLLIQSYFFPIF